ncbi:MAG: 4Fe-4S dicluster domain-containing protein [Candidatus Schekmanbacteria bacterium]|nr:4Fe-4S dicluster domain-containing protein [Candidatus Schekmanbacteria bacterium]
MPRYGMVIDLDRCTGCRACMAACKVENNTPEGSFWMYVFRFEEGEYPNTRIWFMPRPCMHCDNAPCAKVCPVGARYKREDGIVATDWDRCIGCRYCEVACPYSVNYFNWRDPEENQYVNWKDPELEALSGGVIPPYKNPDLDRPCGPEKRHIAGASHVEGVIEKCTFCVHRVEAGKTTACAANCPEHAIIFGDLDDPASEPSQKLQRKSSFRLLEEAGTHPRVQYVGGTPHGHGWRQIQPAGKRS